MWRYTGTGIRLGCLGGRPTRGWRRWWLFRPRGGFSWSAWSRRLFVPSRQIISCGWKEVGNTRDSIHHGRCVAPIGRGWLCRRSGSIVCRTTRRYGRCRFTADCFLTQRRRITLFRLSCIRTGRNSAQSRWLRRFRWERAAWCWFPGSFLLIVLVEINQVGIIDTFNLIERSCRLFSRPTRR